MTAALGPGAPLICIDATPAHDSEFAPLTQGAIYFCEEVVPSYIPGTLCPRDGCGSVGVVLKGKSNPQFRRLLYCPNRFKPLGEGGEHLAADNERVFTEEFTLEDEAEHLLKPLWPRRVLAGAPAAPFVPNRIRP